MKLVNLSGNNEVVSELKKNQLNDRLKNLYQLGLQYFLENGKKNCKQFHWILLYNFQFSEKLETALMQV